MPDHLAATPPTFGDMRAAATRLLDQCARSCPARLDDALTVRDWLEHALLCMRCCFRAQTSHCAHVHCEALLGRLLDDRQTTGVPEPGQCTDAQLDGDRWANDTTP